MDDEKKDTDVNNEDDTSGEQSDLDKNDSTGSEAVKNTEETTAKDLLHEEEKRILVDKTRFDDRNEKAKLYETFAPVIEKYRDDPEKLKELLGEKDDVSIADRLASIEQDRKAEKRSRLESAVNNALGTYKHFKEAWPQIKDDVEMFIKRGVSEQDAVRRSYLGLYPEEHTADMQRRAQERANDFGSFSEKEGRAPNVIGNDDDENYGLSENDQRIATSLIGKDFGVGQNPFKSKEDFAKALKRHEAHLRSTGFYDI